MNPSRWSRIEQLYHDALALAPQEREAFLLQACGQDADLQNEVLSLLRSKNVDTLLEQPVWNLPGLVPGTIPEIQPGSRLGPYQIEKLLGTGGMGEVYLASDTRLDRQVAIKAISPCDAAEPNLRARFLQEARAVSALNHPNIVALHDIATEQGRDFLVFEFVDGETLETRMRRGGLSFDESLFLAAEIADALAAAHSAGITHRDLKPANVILTAEGRVKVIDFGLAKFHDPALARKAKTARTVPGLIIGTAPYMSPEQAAGGEADYRTDIFSLGLVLYEMACGQRPFDGESHIETLNAIRNTAQTPAAVLRPALPPELDDILDKALAKDRRERYQHVGDFALDLRRLRENCRAGTLRSRRAEAPGGAGIRPRAAIGFALALAAALGLSGYALLSRHAQPRRTVLTRLTAEPGLATHPALSPDGKLLAYASDRAGEGNLDIWVQQVAGGEPLRITRDTADESEPSFSPDGSVIAFRSEREGGGIYVAPALGGESRQIADGGHGPRFSPDGSLIAYWTGRSLNYLPGEGLSRIHVIPATGGEPRDVQADFNWARWPVWSHDGRHLLFLGARDRKSPPDWWTAPLAGGAAVETAIRKSLVSRRLAGWPEVHFQPAAWSADNRVLFAATSGDSTNLWQVRVDPGQRATAAPEQLTFGSGIETAGASANGRLVFSVLSNYVNLWALPLDAALTAPSGAATRITQGPAFDYLPSISSDRMTLSYMSTRSKVTDLWLRNMRTGRATVAAANVPPGQHPTISRDGSLLLFGGADGKLWYSIGLSADSARLNTRRPLCDDCWPVSDLSPDRRWVVHDRPARVAMVARDMSDGRTTELIRTAKGLIGRARISPDGRWLAFNGGDGGNRTVYLVPFRPGTPVTERDWIPLSGNAFAGHPEWSPNSRLVYYFSDRDGKFCIWGQRINPESGRPEGDAIPVWHLHDFRRSLGGVTFPQMGMVMDSDRLIVNLSELSGNIWMSQNAPE